MFVCDINATKKLWVQFYDSLLNNPKRSQEGNDEANSPSSKLLF